MNFFKRIFRKSNNDKLDKSLEKTSSSFLEKIKKVVVGKTKVDATTLDDLEEVLITSDVGVKTTLKIIDSIEERVKKGSDMLHHNTRATYLRWSLLW